MVLAGELAGDRLLLGLVEGGVLKQFLELSVEVLVGELQLGDAVLVVEGDGAPSSMESRKL